MIAFTVFGVPQTAGSKRAFPITPKGGGKPRIIITDDNPKGKGWRDSVIAAALETRNGQNWLISPQELMTGALSVRMRFYRPRPKGHFGKHGLNKTGRESIAPTSRPDVLKLARCAEDALTGIIWRDDAQIVYETLAKWWGEPARAEIEIRQCFFMDN